MTTTINATRKLTDIMEEHNLTPTWIHYTIKDNKKIGICGRGQNWTKNECSNNSLWLAEKNNENRYCVMEFDMKNTNLAIFDDDKRGRTLDETLKEYPFLTGCYYQEGNTKGFHFIIENTEFNGMKKIIRDDLERDLITDIIWCKSNKVYGDNIINADMSIINDLFQPSIITPKTIKIKKKKNVIKIDSTDNTSITFVEELLNNIDIQYCDSYQDWFNIVSSLKSIDKIDLIDTFSQRSSKYKIGNYDNIIAGINGSNYSIGTIHHYSKVSNSNQHFTILEKYNKMTIKPYEELGDSDYADLFNSLTDEIFYHSVNEIFYGYNTTLKIWEEKNKNNMLHLTQTKLVHYLNVELKKIHVKAGQLDACESTSKECGCKSCSTNLVYSKQIKQLLKNVLRCKGTSNTLHVIDFIMDKLKNQGKDITMNSNPYLFCWNNKTYDIKNKIFTNRNKYDYITTTTGYDYIEPDIDHTTEVNNLLTDIFSNDEVMKCYFSVCRSGLTGVLEEKFTLANGSGGNGKGLINGMMASLLGNYYHDVSHSVITKEITGDKPLPELSKLGGKRFCVISEIKEDSLLLEDSIKKLTNPIINARGLYSGNTRITNTSTFVAECNARPKIQGDNGNAMIRRYIDVYFNKKYTDDETKIGKDGWLKADSKYKTKDWQTPRRIAFFHWLVNNFNKTIYEPPVVKERSKSFLKECNIPLTVFEDHIEKCEYNSKDKKTVLTGKRLLEIIRSSEEYNNLEKNERKAYTKTKISDFLKTNYDTYYTDKLNICGTTMRECIKGFKEKNKYDDVEDDDETIIVMS